MARCKVRDHTTLPVPSSRCLTLHWPWTPAFRWCISSPWGQSIFDSSNTMTLTLASHIWKRHRLTPIRGECPFHADWKDRDCQYTFMCAWFLLSCYPNRPATRCSAIIPRISHENVAGGYEWTWMVRPSMYKKHTSVISLCFRFYIENLVKHQW